VKRTLPPLIALFVGAITLAFTVGLCIHERNNEQARLRAVFDGNARQTAGRIEQRIANYEQMLRGVEGLLSADQGIDRTAFATYVDTVMSGPDAAGLQSIGFATLVTSAGLADHVGHQRMTGRPDYRVRPEGVRELYAPLVLIAPDSMANRFVLGYDAMSDATRRVAMLQARDSGNAALTALVQLRVDAGPELRAGCLIYLPVYAKGASVRTVAERRASAIGWVRAAFRVGDLMSTLYGEQRPGLLIRLHDGADTGEASLMYSTATVPEASADAREQMRVARFNAREYVTFAGHTWTMELSSLPEFERVHARNASTVILVGRHGAEPAAGRDRAPARHGARPRIRGRPCDDARAAGERGALSPHRRHGQRRHLAAGCVASPGVRQSAHLAVAGRQRGCAAGQAAGRLHGA
jgi:CHASE1-domain containing sensor protein